MVYGRTVKGQTLELEPSGALESASLVMRDRQTDSWWSLMSSEAMGGPLLGTKLPELPLGEKTTWAAWRAKHPDTLMLSVEGREHLLTNPYDSYLESDRTFRDIGSADDRLPEREPIFAFRVAGKPWAVPHRVVVGGKLLALPGAGQKLLLYRSPGASLYASTEDLAGPPRGHGEQVDRRAAPRRAGRRARVQRRRGIRHVLVHVGSGEPGHRPASLSGGRTQRAINHGPRSSPMRPCTRPRHRVVSAWTFAAASRGPSCGRSSWQAGTAPGSQASPPATARQCPSSTAGSPGHARCCAWRSSVRATWSSSWRRPTGSGVAGTEITVLAQPANRGTAAGILLPLLHIQDRDPNAVLALFPSDHFVAREWMLVTAVARAAAIAGSDAERVLLLGIRPEAPDPSYGWLVPGPPVCGAMSVRAFVEKPGGTAAEGLMRSGALVSTFIIVGAGMAFLSLFSAALPDLLASFRRGGDLAALYRTIPDLDFSRDVLERVPERLALLPVPPCGWTDLGTPERVTACLRHYTPVAGTGLVPRPPAGALRLDFTGLARLPSRHE